MAQQDGRPTEPPPTTKQKIKRLFGLQNHAGLSAAMESSQPQPHSITDTASEKGQQHRHELDEVLTSNHRTRVSRSVVPGLPRAKTFGRQLSEDRSHLLPVDTTADERRAVSMDRRSRSYHVRMAPHAGPDPRTSAPGILSTSQQQISSQKFAPDEAIHLPEDETTSAQYDEFVHGTGEQFGYHSDIPADLSDAHSIMTSQSQDEFDELINQELETTWILNLSMRYKDQSNREKFFVTYRQQEDHGDTWRRVTVTLDYRRADEGSLEKEIACTKYQRRKSAKIYEAIRDSLREIQFYDTVTNLKLETINDRLHVHVVEDTNEIIHYPHVNQVRHLGCRRIREQDIVFDHHMSGFVYKVEVHGEVLIKKEIPGPDTIEEFLYEVNALNSVGYSDHVINFYGLVVDERDEYVKGLLISFADGGALIDVIYDNCKVKNARGLEWSVRERWARQIVHGLADIHESGFVQGDFTLSNIVIDDHDDAKIIDVNRRGCPVGWEPPEATPLIESHHRISMYIGVKSDLFQLGMVLWALAMEEDEPEREGRPLTLSLDENIPEWYRTITDICLSPDPRKRLQASILLTLIPDEMEIEPHLPLYDTESVQDVQSEHVHTEVSPSRNNDPSPSFSTSGQRYTSKDPSNYQSWQYAPRGRSPPSPLPSNLDDGCESPYRLQSRSAWAENRDIRPSYSDVGADEMRLPPTQQLTPSASAELKSLLVGGQFEEHIPRPQSMERLRPIEDIDAGQGTLLGNETDPTIEPPLVMVESVEIQPTQQAYGLDHINQGKTALEEISPNIQRVEEDPGVSKLETHPTTTGSHEPEALRADVASDDETPRAEATVKTLGHVQSAPLEPTQGDLEDGTSLDAKMDPLTTSDNQSDANLVETRNREALDAHHSKDQIDDSQPSSENDSEALALEDFVSVGEASQAERDPEPGEPQGADSQAKVLEQSQIMEAEASYSTNDTLEEGMGSDTLVAREVDVPPQANLSTSDLASSEPPSAEPDEGESLVIEEAGPPSSKELPPRAAENYDQPQGQNDVAAAEATTEVGAALAVTEPQNDTSGAHDFTETPRSVAELPRIEEEKTQADSATTAQASTVAGAAWSDTQDQNHSIGHDMGQIGPYADYSLASGMSSGGKQDAMGWAGSLAGIGAEHLSYDDDLLRGADINEDFQCLAQPDAQTAVMITTDSKS